MLTRMLGLVAVVCLPSMLAGGYAVADSLLHTDVQRARPVMKRPAEWAGAVHQHPPEYASWVPIYRVPVRIDLSKTAIPAPELDVVLHEINRIWAQAGICFGFSDVRFGPVRAQELTLRFIGGGDDLPVFGAFDGSMDMWTLDAPSLLRAPHPTGHPASRTASHELGHALSLSHHVGLADSIDSLMTPGRRGFRLHADEIDVAREAAARLGAAGRPCPAPRIL
jgi:hypothetical protein